MGKYLQFTLKNGKIITMDRPDQHDDYNWGRAYSLFRQSVRVEEF